MRKHTELQTVLRFHFGTLTRAAAYFGVTEACVNNWGRKNPAPFLKHIREFHRYSGLSYGEIAELVTRTEQQIE
jgi:hypothetical protein